MKSGPRLIAILAVAGALSLAALYLIVRPEGNGAAPDGPSKAAQTVPEPGLGQFKPERSPLPQASFQDGEGKTLTMDAFKGRWVLLNLWATWCTPCREEMPSLDRLQAEWGGEDFTVVAVSMDRNGASLAKAFLAEVNATHLALYADPSSKMMFAFKAFGLPTTLLISPEGEIRGRFVGPVEWDDPSARRVLEEARGAAKAG